MPANVLKGSFSELLHSFWNLAAPPQRADLKTSDEDHLEGTATFDKRNQRIGEYLKTPVNKVPLPELYFVARTSNHGSEMRLMENHPKRTLIEDYLKGTTLEVCQKVQSVLCR
jgi:hypothetical protein